MFGMEDRVRRLDELNAAIEVAIRDLRKLVAERDELAGELQAEQAISPGDPTDDGSKTSAEFVVPWAPEEEAL